MSRVAVIAGEPSGDLHAAALVRELSALRPDLEYFGLGGDRMREAGVELLYDVEELAVVGFTELLGKALFFRRVMRAVRRQVRARQPALMVLVDYPGFNLRLASWAKRAGFAVFYYIAPQVWAWGKGRLRKMAASLDRLAVILPFEQDFFRAAGIDARYVGHPLVDQARTPLDMRALRERAGIGPENVVLGILPGSRTHEVRRLLPVMGACWDILSEQNPSLRPVVALPPSLGEDLVERWWPASRAPVRVSGMTREVLAASRLALVASGTATLEAAYAGTPMVVLYKVSTLSAMLVRQMIRIPDIALVNVVAGRRVVPELLQGSAEPATVARAAAPLLEDCSERRAMLGELGRVRERLGPPGASAKAASLVAEMLP